MYLTEHSTLSAIHVNACAFYQVDWQKADAFEPATYAHIMPTVNGVVHTMGTLLEGGGYKAAIKEGNLGALLRSYLTSGGGNPLEKDTRRDSYEAINRDAGE
jgi:hypothetical protein